MNKAVKLSVNFSLIALLSAALIVGNKILDRYQQEVSSRLSPPIVDEQEITTSAASGQEMSRKLLGEGATLLKNENHTLPLSYETDKKVNVFGWRSVDWIYGSEGENASGGVAPEDDDFSKNVDLFRALNDYGITYNEDLKKMYESYVAPDHQSAHLRGTNIRNLISLREPSIDDKTYYTDDLLEKAKSFSDTAIVVIGRMAGEAMDCSSTTQQKKGPNAVNDSTRHYLELSKEEEALLTYCGANFKKVIVLMNVANPFEMGFLKTIPNLGACLYLGFTGTRAMDELPKLLYGEYSPSGHTVDIFPYDEFTNPANLFLGQYYTDFDRGYLDAVENVYVGYKWYETADAEKYWDGISNDYGTGYDGVVQFPLGYGLSYSDFSWEVTQIQIGDQDYSKGHDFTDKTPITFTVKVTNNGTFKAKDVLEAYVVPPYTPGGIEKPYENLAGFTKTNLLDPGASETLTLSIDPYEFASYDCYDKNGNGFKGYELEKGQYTIALKTDSHHVKKLTAFGEEKEGNFDFSVKDGITIPIDPVTQQPVQNLFTGEDAKDRTPIDAKTADFDPEIPWLTRSSFLSLDEMKAKNQPRPDNPSAKVDWVTTERVQSWNQKTGTDDFGDPIPTEAPTWGAKNGLKVAENGVINELGEKLAKDYNDPDWDKLLDELTIDEVKRMISNYYGSAALDSVGKPKLFDLDGPAQIKGFASAPRGTGYPTMVIIASTWNPKLAYDFGKAFGDDMKSVSVMGVWGWAMDIHRTAFFGRNHESPSEDSFLAGTIVTNAVKGLSTRGRYCFLKHFALYGQGGPDKWMTEQALRENYLRQFRMAFVEGGALGAMTTYTGVGGEHSETTQALLTGVLRKEWQFRGAVTSDYITVNPWLDALLRSGGDLGMGVSLDKLSGVTYDASSSPRVQHMLRENAHHVLYMWLKADSYEKAYKANPDEGDSYLSSTAINSWVWWKPTVLVLNVSVATLLVLWGILVLLSAFYPKTKKKELIEGLNLDEKGGTPRDK